MENLIMNPQWRPGPDGNPMYFSGNGLTYDKRIYQGNRTCSISRMETSPEPGLIAYDPPIVVAGKILTDGQVFLLCGAKVRPQQV